MGPGAACMAQHEGRHRLLPRTPPAEGDPWCSQQPATCCKARLCTAPAHQHVNRHLFFPRGHGQPGGIPSNLFAHQPHVAGTACPCACTPSPQAWVLPALTNPERSPLYLTYCLLYATPLLLEGFDVTDKYCLAMLALGALHVQVGLLGDGRGGVRSRT